MKLSILFLFISFLSFGQQSLFSPAYQANPHIPAGLLETIAWTRTRTTHLGDDTQESCSGLPKAFGIMGLFENGKNYFNENATIVAEMSGISIQDQKDQASNQILAFGIAFNAIYNSFISTNSEERSVYLALDALSEIPDTGRVNLFARDAQNYEVLNLMNDSEFANDHGFIAHHYNLASVFGAENLNVLSARKIILSDEGIKTVEGTNFSLSVTKSAQYGPAIWSAAPSCNFSSRSGTAVSAITIHTIQGSYAGAISWSQNCSSNVSFHYVIRSSDGQVTQMVLEQNKAWHVGSENPYTIGYEHEGYIDNASWYTQAMYNSSADLSRDIVGSGYGISGLRTYFGTSLNALGSCNTIKGHQHFAGQTHTDPGINWNWEKYYRLINNSTTVNTITSSTGSFYDSGGAGGEYSDDERFIWKFAPTGALNVTLSFSSFNVESNFDYLYMYDGPTIDSPLLGRYTGTSGPGSITSSGNALTVEFRSDCFSTNPGWAATYTSNVNNNQEPVTTVTNTGAWRTADFNVPFTDTDTETSIDGKYYVLADQQTTDNGWQANTAGGFVYEDFEDNSSNWVTQVGTFARSSNRYSQTDLASTNSNAYLLVNQTSATEYLYEWEQNITSAGASQRAGLHFMCSDPTLTNRGNSYFIFLRETNDEVHIYSVDSDVFTLQSNVPYSVNVGTNYKVKTTYSPTTGWIKVYINNVFVSSWQDATPLTSGSGISLRTGNCAATFDNIKVFKSRSSIAPATVGVNSNLRYESIGGVATGKVEALSKDATNLWSNVATSLYLIDYSKPTIDYISDGSGVDIDTSLSATISGNWLMSDLHSGVASYEYAIGTTANGTNVVNWTTSGNSTFANHLLTNPIYNQIYYYSVRSINGAGITSNLFSSDGQLLVDGNVSINSISEELAAITVFPNPTVNEIEFSQFTTAFTAQLVDLNGKIVSNKKIQSTDNKLNLSTLPAGVYRLIMKTEHTFIVKEIVKL